MVIRFIADEPRITSGTLLLKFIKKQKLSYFVHIKRYQTQEKLILEGKLNSKETEKGQKDIGRRMWRTGWGLASGDWGEQQKIG